MTEERRLYSPTRPHRKSLGGATKHRAGRVDSTGQTGSDPLDTFGIDTSMFGINANAHYLFPMSDEAFTPYVLGDSASSHQTRRTVRHVEPGRRGPISLSRCVR
jgi:hypothetical protein